ncbi:MAG: NAD-dependent epimerase/dehydratase family protein, partial [Oscillospiraceae bacterium]
MKILVTGANGFVGKNLVCELASQGFTDVFSYDIDTKHDLLDKYCKECDFVFHLAGVNRPQNQDDFMKGNFGFTDEMLTLLKKHNNHAPILITSSVQATLDNPYGKSKKAGEDLMFAYGKENNVKVFVYRLYNLFGKWCRPNYNSVTATFCYNVAHELPIEISNENTELSLCYIDDVVTEFINALRGNPTQNGKFMTVKAVYTVTLGKLAHLINSFSDSRATKEIADMSNPFVKKLYSTYLSYLPTD